MNPVKHICICKFKTDFHCRENALTSELIILFRNAECMGRVEPYRVGRAWRRESQ